MLLGSLPWTGLTLVQRQVADPAISQALAVGVYVGTFLIVTAYPRPCLAVRKVASQRISSNYRFPRSSR